MGWISSGLNKPSFGEDSLFIGSILQDNRPLSMTIRTCNFKESIGCMETIDNEIQLTHCRFVNSGMSHMDPKFQRINELGDHYALWNSSKAKARLPSFSHGHGLIVLNSCVEFEQVSDIGGALPIRKILDRQLVPSLSFHWRQFASLLPVSSMFMRANFVVSLTVFSAIERVRP
jgi:hypothetical protein